MYTCRTILLVCLLGGLNFSFLTTEKLDADKAYLSDLQTFNQELCNAYNTGENLILVDPTGKQYLNPNKNDLLKLSPELFNQNRIRVTIMGRSENNLCSTELVITDSNGGLEGNYTVNSCSSYGWIFFTPTNCFEVALFHDAGLEAPYGSAVNGSVDWTFQFNQNNRISGTLMDAGEANMYKVANPCYESKQVKPIVPMDSKKRAATLRTRYGS